jgi:hypothetical protein
MLNQLAILLFTSSKGHFGFKNSYEFIVKNLRYKLNPGDKIAHIKYEDGDWNTLALMEDFLEKEGYGIISTEGKWSHNSISHAQEYYKDQLRLFSSHAKPYSLLQEDDFLIRTKEGNTEDMILQGLNFLEDNPQALCVRINSEPIRTTKGATRISEYIFRQDEDFTPYGSTFTFQPTIVRTRDYYQALRIINQNLHLLETTHCELLSGHVFKQFSTDTSPFYFFDPDLIWCEHIGEKEKLEKLNSLKPIGV